MEIGIEFWEGMFWGFVVAEDLFWDWMLEFKAAN